MDPAMKRPYRILAAFATMVALVFAQAVSAAYACAGPVPDPVAMAQMKAAMGPDGGLCEQHCSTGTISLEAAKPSFAAMAAVLAVPLRVVSLELRAPRTLDRAAPLSVAGPSPPLIRFTVLRI
jgi:hypothetical protein